MTVVPIGRETIVRAVQFTRTIVQNDHQSHYAFHNKNLPRPMETRIVNCALGKVSEEALCHFLAVKYGLQFHMNYEIYEDKGIGDGGNDFPSFDYEGINRINNLYIDVKSNNGVCFWLLQETKEALNSDVTILVRILAGRDVGIEWLENTETIECDILGYATRKMLLLPTGDPKYHFKRGDTLYHPSNPKHKLNMTLNAESNAGYPVGMLLNAEKDWRRFVEKIVNESKNSN